MSETSVICTVKNGAQTIASVIESIQAQTLKQWEFVIVDDGSTDETREIVGKYASADNRIKLIQTPGIGRGRALNLAIAQSNSECIANIDADDPSHQNQVLFISQGTIGRDLSRLAVDLRQKLSPKYKVVYKLHPGEYRQWESRYPWLISGGLKVVDDDSISLYELLAESKALVGVNSTVIYEGLGLGLKIVLANLPGVESMYELRQRRICQ